MGDPADDWLRANDPEYHEAKKDYPDIRRTGTYRSPKYELPAGDGTQVAGLAERGIAQWIQPVLWRPCLFCGVRFKPERYWQKHCKPAHRQAYYRQNKAA